MYRNKPLKDLKKQIQDLPLSGVAEALANHCMGYDIEENDEDKIWAGTLLYVEDVIGVVHSIIRKGVTLKRHNHKMKEYLILYKGSIRRRNGVEFDVVFKAPYVIINEVGQPHRVTALEKCGIVGITMPPDPGYPK